MQFPKIYKIIKDSSLAIQRNPGERNIAKFSLAPEQNDQLRINPALRNLRIYIM